MQKLTIIDSIQGKIHRTAKYNIGQNVYVIEWREGKPIIMNCYILFIGIEHNQYDDFMYMVNLGMRLEEHKKYYEKDIYDSKEKCLRAIEKQLKYHLTGIKEMKRHPYYKDYRDEL